MTKQNSTQRTAKYRRVSKGNGRSAAHLQRTTLGDQDHDLESSLPRNAVVVADLVDVDESGASSDRPAFRQLFELAEGGELDLVAVPYLSRFGRSAREVLDNVHRLRKAGVTFFSAKEGLRVEPKPSPAAKLLLAVLAAVAEMELDRLTEGLGRANAQAVANGNSIAIPYGYTRPEKGGPLVADNEPGPDGRAPAAMVRAIFNLAVDGLGNSEIAERLNAERVPTPTALAQWRGTREKPGADLWRHNAVGNLLAVHTYRGVIPRATAFKERTTKAGKVKRIPVAWEYLPGGHEPLVDDATWKAAQRTPQRAIRNGRTGGSLLQGLVRCASCSHTMRPSSGGSGRGLTYACKGKGCQARAQVMRATLDAHVMGEVLEGRTEVLATVESQRAELPALQAAFDLAEAELEDFENTASASQMKDRYMRVWQRHVDARDAALEKLNAAKEVLAVTERTTHADFADQPLEDQRMALRDLLDAVVVVPGRGNVPTRTTLVWRGQAPFALSGTGRVVQARAWPL